VIIEQKHIDEMSLEEQLKTLARIIEDKESFAIITDGDGNEVSPSEFIQATQRKRKRQKKNGAYHPASYWADLVGIHEDTFRRKLEKIKSGGSQRSAFGKEPKNLHCPVVFQSSRKTSISGIGDVILS
jgi:hypothetical protein